MSIKPHVQSGDAQIKSQREAAAERVINYFGVCLPESELLCFLDDEDPSTLRNSPSLGPANRGLYMPIHDNTVLDGWPSYVTNCIRPSDRIGRRTRVIDDFVYLYGTTCVDEVGLTMTLAHELQHSIQHAQVRKLWAANSLVRKLDKKVIDALNLKWSNIPTEVEARIVSKCVGECLLGEQRVNQYIDRKIAERITDDDADDWEFIRTLTPSDSVDLASSTQLLFELLKGCRPELEALLRKVKQTGNPDFTDIDLDAFFVPPRTAK
ncbi:MAG: hypothetical protein LAN18_14230 [Acidobacteriia bacterium]|nr:hypothetical protein [Terriglobia bacterium]